MDSVRDQPQALAAEVAAGLERVIRLFRWISPPSGLSLTSAATLATLERGGPRRLTALASREGVTQPAMTQLVARRSRDEQAALAAALPAIDALANAQRDDPLVGQP